MKNRILIALMVLTGAALSVHAARARVNGAPAQKMWEALDIMAKFENLPLHSVNGATDTLEVRKLACASEMYDACSFFVKVNGAEKLIVHTDAAGKIIDALYANGIYPSEDDPSLTQAVEAVSCSKTNDSFECTLTEYRK